ncbi:hypothetical protein L2747_05360 [Shewanella marinintestina]|uniref:hypothetical protein n=1 Tax=Shewanella marinintestina TaxID=190305 RepID=UPI00200C0E7E|nr:hypothetical protein [Shewanella marinintestina]MCL1145446.1 hypothetical protein [Shewanella marinintestina]
MINGLRLSINNVLLRSLLRKAIAGLLLIGVSRASRTIAILILSTLPLGVNAANLNDAVMSLNSTIQGDNLDVNFTPRVSVSRSESHPVVGQKVVLRYELLVDGFFNGGTQFELPSISSASLAKASSFAINGSKRLEGRNLTSQIWEVYLYPEQQGLIQVPSISFAISYQDASSNSSKSTILLAKPALLYAYVPPELDIIAPYLVAEAVTIEDNWSTLKDSYQQGDVITRSVVIVATNLPASHIPPFKAKQFDGGSIIAREPQLEDISRRGESLGRLTQEFSYLIETSGDYSLGGETISWWKLGSGVEQHFFTTFKIDVVGWSQGNWYQLVFILSCAAIILLGRIVFRYQKNTLYWKARHALVTKDWPLFVGYLYQQRDSVKAISRLKQETQLDTSSKQLMRNQAQTSIKNAKGLWLNAELASTMVEAEKTNGITTRLFAYLYSKRIEDSSSESTDHRQVAEDALKARSQYLSVLDMKHLLKQCFNKFF